MSLRRVFRSRKFSRSFKEFGSTVDGVDRRNGINSGEEEGSPEYGNAWSAMLPEIIRRVEANEEQWPQRQNVVACACVCKRWRDITREIVRANSQTGKITFPSCLKQPGPSDLPQQCLIKRNKKTSTFYLYLALTLLMQLDQLSMVSPSTNRLNPKEKYIQLVTVDGYEFFFMGFLAYDKALKTINEALQQYHNHSRGNRSIEVL